MIDIDIILNYLALDCIKNKRYRDENTFFHFDNKFIIKLLESNGYDNPDILKIKGGYMFLDNDEENYQGMIRLYSGQSNPKWSFIMNEDEELEIEFC